MQAASPDQPGWLLQLLAEEAALVWSVVDGGKAPASRLHVNSEKAKRP